MRILLFNDTRIETNPGCQATVHGLINLIEKTYPGAEISTIHSGYGYHFFSDSYRKISGLSLFQRLARKIRRRVKPVVQENHPHLYKEAKIDISLWKTAIHRLETEDTELIHNIQNSDIIIINMEGTVHHNRTGGLVLIGIGKIAKRYGKKVMMVNGSIQAMDRTLLRELKSFDHIAVREKLSFNYLRRNKIPVIQSADAAFLSDIFCTDITGLSIPEKNAKKCLFTAGVLAAFPGSQGGYKIEQVIEQIRMIKAEGYEVSYLHIEGFEKELEKHIVQEGVEIVTAPWQSIGNLIAQFDLVITGRYHIAIFSLMARIPVIAFISNSWKIEGLYILTRQAFLLTENLNQLKETILKVKNINSSFNNQEMEKLAANNLVHLST